MLASHELWLTNLSGQLRLVHARFNEYLILAFAEEDGSESDDRRTAGSYQLCAPALLDKHWLRHGGRGCRDIYDVRAHLKRLRLLNPPFAPRICVVLMLLPPTTLCLRKNWSNEGKGPRDKSQTFPYYEVSSDMPLLAHPVLAQRLMLASVK